MILDDLLNAAAYEGLHPLFPAAFAFLRDAVATGTFEADRVELDGERLFALIAHSMGRSPGDAPLESHRRYIDIQFVVSGSDRMGWRPAREARPGRGYDAARDIEFHDGAPATWFDVAAGRMAIFFPDDAHAPLANPGEPVHKIVIKVAVDSDPRRS
jgi:YhcH/YjgK/YiaL family protein